MNTIRRPRKRPRRSSINFRVFHWVLLRVVAFEVLSHTSMIDEPRNRLRAELIRLDRHKVIAWTWRNLEEYERRQACRA